MNRHTSDPSAKFFEQVAASPHPLLHNVTATVRIDLDDNGGPRHWLLRIDHGQVDVSTRKSAADAVIGTDRALFELITTGEANVLTAALRGRVRIRGDSRLLVAFNRLMPGPPNRTTTVPPTDRTAMAVARRAKAADTTARTAKPSAAADRATRKDRTR